MKILTWNIQHGGGKRISDIAHVLVAHAADIIVLSEFRSPSGDKLCSILRHHGWAFQAGTEPPSGVNGLLIANRMPFNTQPEEQDGPNMQYRWLEVHLPANDVSLVAVHVPNPGEMEMEKDDFWKCILRRADALKIMGRAAVITGDFNTGQHFLDETGATLRCAGRMNELLSSGWSEAWRSKNPNTREFTWYSAYKNGFRLDHAFLSPKLSPWLASAKYSHVEREQKISDHSILLTEFSIDVQSV